MFKNYFTKILTSALHLSSLMYNSRHISFNFSYYSLQRFSNRIITEKPQCTSSMFPYLIPRKSLLNMYMFLVIYFVLISHIIYRLQTLVVCRLKHNFPSSSSTYTWEWLKYINTNELWAWLTNWIILGKNILFNVSSYF